jgi:hypothetical protein
MTPFNQIPVFSDIARPFHHVVKQPPNDFVQIATPNGNQQGSITLRPDAYFVAFALTCFTNYDNVSPVVATANSSAILPLPSTPNNFTLKINRGTFNKFSNFPIPQAQIASSGSRAGKVFPLPVTYGPRTNFQFTFQDTTGLFLLSALSEGTAVPMKIQMFLHGVYVDIPDWPKFASLWPQFSNVFVEPTL